jgi:senataxin
VGDPQQLPATILSEAAKAVAMERSLFERLQSRGCPVSMLSVQYRMHPAIRTFPSRHFYNDELEDAPSVLALPDEPFYSHQLLKPYVVFDVARGRELRNIAGGGSLGNKVRLLQEYCCFAWHTGSPVW